PINPSSSYPGIFGSTRPLGSPSGSGAAPDPAVVGWLLGPAAGVPEDSDREALSGPAPDMRNSRDCSVRCRSRWWLRTRRFGWEKAIIAGRSDGGNSRDRIERIQQNEPGARTCAGYQASPSQRSAGLAASPLRVQYSRLWDGLSLEM